MTNQREKARDKFLAMWWHFNYIFPYKKVEKIWTKLEIWIKKIVEKSIFITIVLEGMLYLWSHWNWGYYTDRNLDYKQWHCWKITEIYFQYLFLKLSYFVAAPDFGLSSVKCYSWKNKIIYFFLSYFLPAKSCCRHNKDSHSSIKISFSFIKIISAISWSLLASSYKNLESSEIISDGGNSICTNYNENYQRSEKTWEILSFK